MIAPDLQKIRAQHGGRVFDGGRRWVGPGPGHSRRDASLSVRITEDGRGLVHSFAGDDFRTCAAHLGLERAEPDRIDRREMDRRRQLREAEEQRRLSKIAAFCSDLWSSAEPIGDTLAARYLASRWITTTPEDLRFHPATPHGYASGATAPAMLALARSVTGAPKAIQATFLAPEAQKTGRVTFGALIGAVVRLGPPGRLLAVSEGMETAASFAELYGVSTWATLGTSNLEAFRPPAAVRHLIIAADGDAAGMKAARCLAERLRHRCDVTISAAPDGYDWNDVATGKAHV